MSMSFGSNYADVVEWSFVESICPEAAARFLKALNDRNVNMEDFARAFKWLEPEYDMLLDDRDIGDQDMDEYGKELLAYLQQEYDLLKKAFAEATTVNNSHLELGVNYHNQKDEGGSYDDVNGVFWCVNGAYQLSPAGEKYKDNFERQFYVTYG